VLPRKENHGVGDEGWQMLCINYEDVGKAYSSLAQNFMISVLKRVKFNTLNLAIMEQAAQRIFVRRDG